MTIVKITRNIPRDKIILLIDKLRGIEIRKKTKFKGIVSEIIELFPSLSRYKHADLRTNNIAYDLCRVSLLRRLNTFLEEAK